MDLTAFSNAVQSTVGTHPPAIPDILAAALILAIGFWLANLTNQAMLRATGGAAVGMANLVRYAILGLVSAMGLSATARRPGQGITT